METSNPVSANGRFPIVGVGASAGGLAALQLFLSHVPAGSGLAIVIVQHLDPDREGMLVELLQRHTTMPVVEASDQLAVAPDHVYVIPAGRDLSILHGVMYLLEPVEPRGLRLPIDFFFKSLADDWQQDSIGVILSGMGHDGTAGLRAIRLAAGACFAQAPATAQFDSMPRSAIDAGVVDGIAPVEELPQMILAYVGRVQFGPPADTQADAAQTDTGFLDKVIVLLRNQTGHDFSQYKRSAISRRVERRMGLHQLGRTSDYLRYLRENPSEADLLFNELLIGVTSFFRDKDVWVQLATDVIPELLASHPGGAVLRAWIPGCATGEEAYSLAMVFREVLEATRPAHPVSLQIFASDLDPAAIATGRAGIYPRTIAVDMSEQRLHRFFVDDPGGYRICNEIREMVIFAEQNVIADPPFTKLDLLSCRNLLIYLESGLQEKLIRLFHYSLNHDGFLILGGAESIDTAGGLFYPLPPGKSHIFRRLDSTRRVLPVGFPAAFTQASDRVVLPNTHGTLVPATPPDLQTLVGKLILQRFAPAAVLVTAQGDLLYLSGRTGKYLEPAAGLPHLNLFSMAREEINLALGEAFHRAMQQKTSVTLKNLRLVERGQSHHLNVTVEPLEDPPGLRGMALIVFTDVPTPRRSRPTTSSQAGVEDVARLAAQVQELQQWREEAKSIREEMQTSQEELKSTNEELQSANEELTTSQEEMQSMNEELQTVNHELQAKVTELSRASNDMKNLLGSTEIATLFLDDALNVRRFTEQTNLIYKLIPGDTGRPITDIATTLQYPAMIDDARQVLRSLVFNEKEVPTSDGRWYKVRQMPYRTQQNRIDGLVITFVDITVSKTLEANLRATQARLSAVIEASQTQGKGNGVS